MFQFFKRKPGKDSANTAVPVAARAPSDADNQTRKDVVNLLIPSTDYNQKTGVGAILQIMAGKKRNRKRKHRSDSCRVSPPKAPVQRSLSMKCDVEYRDENSAPAHSHSDSEFVKALVLQKYAKPDKEHVSLVYVSSEPNLEEKKHAEALLRELAKTIDCTVDEINEKSQQSKQNLQMGGADSKPNNNQQLNSNQDNRINAYKQELNKELNSLLKPETNRETDQLKPETNGEFNQLKPVAEEEKSELDSPNVSKKSNLKIPRSDNEGCSDDERSDNGKKKVTFQKHIIFDDGEQQTDEEVDSSFESISSEEEFLEDAVDNRTVININENEAVTIKIDDCSDNLHDTSDKKTECSDKRTECSDERTDLSDKRTDLSDKRSSNGVERVSSDNSDSGFVEIVRNSSENEELSEVSEGETEEEIIEEIIEEEVSFEEEEIEEEEEPKSIVTQETRFQNQVASITELGDARSEQAERARDLLASYRKELEAKHQEIEQLKCELAAAYKESELIRQRSRSLEEELAAARACSADLAEQLKERNEEFVRELRGELDQALARQGELESRVLALERDRDRLEQEKAASEQKAVEALATAEANTAKWRLAHENARSQAATRAERMLADCEWKMREIEKRARDAEKENRQLKESLEQLKNHPVIPQSHLAELSQLRGLASEQQRSVQSLTLQLQRVETREEALKLEVHRLKDLLEREELSGKEKEELHLKKITTLQTNHASAVDKLKSDHALSLAASRASLERAHADRTRTALAQLREETEAAAKVKDRKLAELNAKYESLKDDLATKERHYDSAIAEARSKADWDILQLRHLLDKADIEYANNVENLSRKFEEEKEQLIEEWTVKLKEVEDQAASEVDEAKKLLEATRLKLIAEKLDQVNKLKDQHRREMDEQWEQFMTDKENCLARMKMECRQEGEEDRVKREKELLEEIAELKSQVHSKSGDFDNLAVKAAACGRTLAVTEQELREALAREKELREKRSEDATKLKQIEKSSKEQIEHLTRKCACLRKLFDDIRARLIAKERTAEQEAKARDKELHHLRGEVARLTKILVEQSSPKLGARTCADGCETLAATEREVERRKGSFRTPEVVRKRTAPLPLPELTSKFDLQQQNGRRRANSVDLPAVQVPVRIKQLEGKKNE